MALYEYSCPKCKEKFEKLKRYDDKHLEACPKCGKLCKRLMGTLASFTFNMSKL
jgi:putative FmdB family regulatory protein